MSLDTYGTRPLSWYADQAPDYLDGEEDIERADREWEERQRDRADSLYDRMKEDGYDPGRNPESV